MTLLDENVPDAQRRKMIKLGIPVRQVGFEWGRKGMSDEEILTALRGGKRVTFLTQDNGFYRGENCHGSYCLVWLAAPADEMAEYVRRFLKHPGVRTHAMRMGKVFRVGTSGITCWARGSEREAELSWA